MRRIFILFCALFLFCGVAQSQETKCTDCHALLKEGDANITLQEIEKSIHSKNDISCISCHGNDKLDETKPNPHLFVKSFKGVPKPREVSEFCGACHKLELENFSKSRHYAETKRGVIKGCISCHGYHTVAEPEHRDFINFCIKCHKENSLEYRTGLDFKNGFESKEAELIKLSRDISNVKDIPGLDTLPIEISQRAIFASLTMLQKTQHAMETSNTKGEFELIAKKIKKENNAISQGRKAIDSRKIWLSLFIFVIFLAIALLNLKYRNL